jgi:hypothetical protein
VLVVAAAAPRDYETLRMLAVAPNLVAVQSAKATAVGGEKVDPVDIRVDPPVSVWAAVSQVSWRPSIERPVDFLATVAVNLMVLPPVAFAPIALALDVASFPASFPSQL